MIEVENLKPVDQIRVVEHIRRDEGSYVIVDGAGTLVCSAPNEEMANLVVRALNARYGQWKMTPNRY